MGHLNQIEEQKRLCGDECKRILNEHLKICLGFDGTGNYKCTDIHPSYYCQFKENGRCSHYYKIEDFMEKLEWYAENIDILAGDYYQLKFRYNKELAKKENRLDEYEREKEEEWDDMFS